MVHCAINSFGDLISDNKLYINKRPNIKAYTIQLQKEEGVERKPLSNDKFSRGLLEKESYLRRIAYKNTPITKEQSFYDDSDMKEEYYLVVVFDADSDTPLLSCRYFYSKNVISRSLVGEEKTEACININDFQNIFLADRLSGNITSPIYRKHRSHIFLLFYLEFLKHCKTDDFILMARREKHDKLLKKYLGLGVELKGSTKHRGVEHWIVLGNVLQCYKLIKLSSEQKMFLSKSLATE